MPKIRRTQFGKDIEMRLVDIGENQSWLIEKVSEATGLYFDRSYLNKIKVGQLNTPKIVQAIKEILQLPNTSVGGENYDNS